MRALPSLRCKASRSERSAGVRAPWAAVVDINAARTWSGTKRKHFPVQLLSGTRPSPRSPSLLLVDLFTLKLPGHFLATS